MKIPFLGQSYNGRSPNVDASRSINFYVELGSPESKSDVTLVGTPGTELFSQIGIDSVRATHAFGNVMYVVTGNRLVSLDVNGVVSGTLGTLNTTVGRVQMLDNGIATGLVGGDQLFIIDGTDGYIYNRTSHTFTVLNIVPIATKVIPKQATYIDSYFVMIDQTMSAYCSNIYDGLTWQPLATAQIAAMPDSVKTVVNLQQQLIFIKEYTTEFWYDNATPTSTGFPFARQSGAVIDFGTPAPWSVARGNYSIFFLANQRNNDGGEFVGVAELKGNVPQVISPQPINYKINEILRLHGISDAFGFCYSDEGHTFYVLTFPAGNVTFVYDATTTLWHERSSYTSAPYTISRYFANTYTYFNNKHLLGDYRNGNIHNLSSAFLDEAGNPIVSTRISQHLSDKDNLDKIVVEKLRVDVETGTGNQSITIQTGAYLANGVVLANGSQTAGKITSTNKNPVASLRWSKDGGHTWNSQRIKPLGSIGEFSKKVWWRIGGRSRNWVFDLTISDPVKKVLINGFIEVSKG